MGQCAIFRHFHEKPPWCGRVTTNPTSEIESSGNFSPGVHMMAFFFFQTRLSTRAGAEQRAWNLWLGVKPFSHSGLPGKWCNSANFWSQASRKILGQLFFHNLSFHVFALSSNGRDFFFNFSLEAKKNSFWRENRRTIWQTEHQCCQRFILANVTAANHFARHGGPFPWRPHFLPS